jgi:hypothetical protein
MQPMSVPPITGVGAAAERVWQVKVSLSDAAHQLRRARMQGLVPCNNTMRVARSLCWQSVGRLACQHVS